MLTTADFLQYTQWSGIATLLLAALTVLGLIFKWGIRFRLVGTTGFMLVLTGGLFALSIVPLSRTVIPGAARFTLVYDNGSTQAVIATSRQITPTQLEATLRQLHIGAASTRGSEQSGCGFIERNRYRKSHYMGGRIRRP